MSSSPERQRRRGGGHTPAADVAEAARAYTRTALKVLVEVMNDPKQVGSTRVRAAVAVLEWGHGKPKAQAKQEAQAALAPPPSGFSFVDGPTPGTEEQWVAKLRAQLDAAAGAAGVGDRPVALPGVAVWRGGGGR